MLELRRIDGLPPYAFAEVERLKLELRRAGEDVVDFGFGNPDLAPPEVAVEKLREAALQPRNHRYSSSRGLPNLRAAACALYRERYGVELDPETEATMTLGAKEGLVHLLWVLLGPGDAVLAPSPSYPIHRFAPHFAGADVHPVPIGPGVDFAAAAEEAWERAAVKPRVLLCSFPHNPTTACADLPLLQRLVDLCRERELLLVHDFAYADLGFDGYRPPSIFEAEGAREVAVELYSLTKGFSLAGWRIAFLLGRADVVTGLARLKSYLDYGSFQPLQIAATVALQQAREQPERAAAAYESRRNVLCDGLRRLGWEVERPRATMFVWAPIAAGEPSADYALRLLREAKVAVSPGSGFGADGEGHVRFALVENEHRIRQAIRNLGQVQPVLRRPAAIPAIERRSGRSADSSPER
ncbi:MAG TPA: aminotransferase class I/II-fold pyridoxal phosphate-dependent enzyme [Gaiellaceae bacterium]|nr:aminotransferase class I/II-fold pyridoxal phosphate-dependent enzyme [Gaiellaceae bacterium]